MDSVQRARRLRRDLTDAERKLWHALRVRRLNGLKFRQVPVGRYIVDFLCIDRQLIVEVDGGQHSPMADAGRTRWLESEGFRVVRFWNNEVLENLECVNERIVAEADYTVRS